MNNETKDMGAMLTGNYCNTAELVTTLNNAREALLVAFLGNEAIEDDCLKNNELPTARELSFMTYILHLVSDNLAHNCNDEARD